MAKKGEKTLAIQWVVLIEFIMKLIEMFMNKKQSAEVRGALVAAVTEDGGAPDPDKAVASRAILQKAFNDTPRVRVGRRASLRWALDEIPPVANDPKPKLSKAVLAEGKALAARDK